jgi:LL-diaminopimelate aminotransferase
MTGAIMAGADPYVMPLKASNSWLPDLDAIPEDVARRARLMWLNYPNNPTAATADRAFLERSVEFCKRYDIVLCHDAPYSEIAFDGYRPLTLFEIPGAKEVGLEFHSLSKTYNMTGWRIGWVCGRADLVNLIGQLKTNIDSGIFQAVQWAAIEALNGGEEETHAANAVYARRHKLVADTLNQIGWSIKPPRATFYVWAPVPDGYDSIGFASHVLDQVGVNITPGVGFGAHGEGYFRLSVTAPDARLEEAMTRMRKLKL